MNKINIVLPYSFDESLIHFWAHNEKHANLSDVAELTKVQVCFASCELEFYLNEILLDYKIEFCGQVKEDYINIILKIDDTIEENCYCLTSNKDGVTLSAVRGTEILYAAYHLLHLQGCRWFAPGSSGEILPEKTTELIIPNENIFEKPSFDNGRAFDFHAATQESEDMWRWMARNRMNVASPRLNTLPLQKKLGLIGKWGGHIFEDMLDQDRPMPGGKILFEEHPEWYGLPTEGERSKDGAQKNQFCMSNSELIDFLAHDTSVGLKTQWQHVDRLDIWGFDTWGAGCACDVCKKLGNNSDRTLHFASELKKRLDIGERKVPFIICSYGGTDTLLPPENPIPENLKDDYLVFYPIDRCYKHDFDDGACDSNPRFNEYTSEWLKHAGDINFVMGEYYNVSKYEDLPLVFSKRITNDLPYYNSLGIKGLTYMHIPWLNWGIRTLNQVLYCALAWNAKADCEAIKSDYFDKRYGKYAPTMCELYAEMEKAFEDVATLRTWQQESILSQLLKWDGKKPSAPLTVVCPTNCSIDEFLKTTEHNVERIEACEETLRIVKEDIYATVSLKRQPPTAVNPQQIKNYNRRSDLGLGIADDLRGVIYGKDVMTFQLLMMKYHNALLNGENTDELFLAIDRLAKEMEDYVVPMEHDSPQNDIFMKDALTRSQLRTLYLNIKFNR